MKGLKNIVARFVSDEQGMETVEWGVMAALIVVGVAAAVALLGDNVKAKFDQLVTATN